MIKSASRSSITNDQKYRSMLAGTVPSSEYLIASTVLTQNEPSVNFNNLAQFAGVYKHLQVVSTARGDLDSTLYSILLRINGVNTANHTYHAMTGNGSTVAPQSGLNLDALFPGSITGTPSPSGSYAASVTDILDAYSTTKNKTVRTFSGSSTQVFLMSGLSQSTSLIDTLTFITSGNFLAGSRFSLYGVTA